MKAFSSNNDENEIKSYINGLTDTENRCLFFLILYIKDKINLIIQGEIAIRKSFIIRLFSKISGQKLFVSNESRL